MFHFSKSLIPTSAIIAFVVLSSACNEKSAKQWHDQGDIKMAEAFTVSEAQGLEDQDRVKIRISKDALNKEFLLQSHITIMPFVGTSNGNKSRVVTFTQSGNELLLKESIIGNSVTDSLEQEFILAKFPITNKSKNYIGFDFNKGMSKLFTSDDWYTSDSDLGSQVVYDSTAAEIELSYLKNAKSNSKNQLILTQIAQIKNESIKNQSNIHKELVTVETTYYLTPYSPNPKFSTTTNNDDFTSTGYFEVAPSYDEEGLEQVFATKFGPGEIVFAMSPNTPEEYKDTVKEGILYWNKAFKEERLKVAEVSAVAPSFDYNVIQWIDWDAAGFAYADAQSDPRTGEILHAQVYLTSVFAISGRKKAEKYLKHLGLDSVVAPGKESKALRFGLNGFAASSMCNFYHKAAFGNSLRELLELDPSDEQIQKLSRDYVRNVVAHEVGHTLGLRHNFAGNLSTNIQPTKKLEALKDYIQSGTVAADVVPTSTVMDYQTFIYSVLSGSQLVSNDTAFKYDETAIQNLYNDVPVTDSETIFCTDSHVDSYVDCNRFDEGQNFLEGQLVSFQEDVAKYLTSSSEEGLPPLAYRLEPKLVAMILLDGARSAFNMFDTKTQSIAATRKFDGPGSLDYLAKEQGYEQLQRQLEAIGGIESLIPTMTLKYPEVEDPNYKRAKINFEMAMASETVSILNTEIVFVDGNFSTAISEYMKKLAREVLTATEEVPLEVFVPILESIVVAEVDNAVDSIADVEVVAPVMRALKLPVFKYSQKVREEAAKILRLGRGEAVNFLFAERLAVAKELHAILSEDSLGIDINNVDVSAWSTQAQRWVLENRVILAKMKK